MPSKQSCPASYVEEEAGPTSGLPTKTNDPNLTRSCLAGPGHAWSGRARSAETLALRRHVTHCFRSLDPDCPTTRLKESNERLSSTLQCPCTGTEDDAHTCTCNSAAFAYVQRIFFKYPAYICQYAPLANDAKWCKWCSSYLQILTYACQTYRRCMCDMCGT